MSERRFERRSESGEVGRRFGLAATFLAGSTLAACGPPPNRSSPDNAMGAQPLATSLIVQVREDRVDLVFQVTNVSRDTVEVKFATAQSYEFEVSRGRERLWSWSADRMFAQVLRAEALAPEATWRYEATWTPESLPPGAYSVEARLTSTSHPLSARAEFEAP